MTEQKPRKIALVTGGNRGIGFEIVRQLAQRGITVILAARRMADAEYASQKISTTDMPVVPLKLDVTDEKDIRHAAQFIEQEFGYLDILVNNGGVNAEANEKTGARVLREVFEVNTIGPFVLIQSLLPLLQKSAAGRIVNQSSILGSLSHLSNDKNLSADWIVPAYSSSKAALNVLTILLAQQLKDTNIKINSAHPGWVKTRMGGEDAPLSVTDGAKTALRLALLPDDGPTGKFFHLDEELPW